MLKKIILLCKHDVFVDQAHHMLPPFMSKYIKNLATVYVTSQRFLTSTEVPGFYLKWNICVSSICS